MAPQKGTYHGGRKKGVPNRSTVEKALRAAAQVEEAKKSGRKIAVDVLDDLMHLTMGMVVQFQKQSLVSPMPADQDWDKFWRCMDAAIECAGKLAKHQSPTFKAIDYSLTVAPPVPEPKTIEQDGNVVRLNDPNRAMQAYLRMVRAPLPKQA